MKYLLLFITLFIFSINTSIGQSLERNIALLDLSQQNEEINDSHLFSAEHLLQVAGIPFRITTDPNVAIQSAMILCSSQLNTNTLTDDEINKLNDFVSGGGVLVVPRVLDDAMFSVFGIAGFAESNTHFQLNWNQGLSTSLFRWINEPEEWSISLGSTTIENIFKTYSYDLNSAIPLGNYGDGRVAVAQNSYGNGFAYSFGVSWKDVILRSQINRDYEAQRIGSNGFEPTQDVFILLMRAIFCEHVPHGIWKHTSLANSTSTLMITHDVDSRTGVDSLPFFAEAEKAKGISATYNVTLRYFADSLMSDFYIGSFGNLNDAISNGHVIGSHSVGHFTDFGDDDVFPIGSPGNTMANYNPFNNGTSGTVGGTVFGECEVSKNVLEADHNVEVLSFRAGHLVNNKYLINVLDSLGYLYNSSQNANDVLTHFPYSTKVSRSFSGERSNIYELPVTISDVFNSDPMTSENYFEKIDTWLDAVSKINANNATTVLLIHPNRGYKLVAQEYFISHLPENIYIEELSAFGGFWKDRTAFDFNSQLMGDSMLITISSENLILNKNISLVVNKGQELSGIIVQDENGNNVDFITENWADNDIILYRNDLFFTNTKVNKENLSINIYPNPTRGDINIELNLNAAAQISVEVINQNGQTVKIKNFGKKSIGCQNLKINSKKIKMVSGIYFCKINIGENGSVIEKILVE